MKRSDCLLEPRPCMRFSCKHNLTTDVFELDEIENKVRTNTLRKTDFKYATNCVLDLTDRFCDGMSHYDIAEILGISSEAVRLVTLKALTSMRAQVNSSNEIDIESLYSFLNEHFSPHKDDIEVCLEAFPRLTYQELILYAKGSGVLEQLEFSDDDFEKLLNPELIQEDDEFIERYNLQSVPFQYEKSVIGTMLGFSGNIVDIWIDNGLPFTISRTGDTLVDRADVLRHLNEHGQYMYRILHVKKIPMETFNELRLDLLQEVNET
jgi:hypothetical protein